MATRHDEINLAFQRLVLCRDPDTQLGWDERTFGYYAFRRAAGITLGRLLTASGSTLSLMFSGFATGQLWPVVAGFAIIGGIGGAMARLQTADKRDVFGMISDEEANLMTPREAMRDLFKWTQYGVAAGVVAFGALVLDQVPASVVKSDAPVQVSSPQRHAY